MTALPVAAVPAAIITFGDLPSNTLRITPANVAAGQSFWRVRKATTLLPHETGGLHHVFVRCFRNGNRSVGVPVRFFWPDGEASGPTEDKPIQELGDWNAGLFGDWRADEGPGPYSVTIADGTASEVFSGFGLPRKQHYTYVVEFEQVTGGPALSLEEQVKSEARARGFDLNNALTRAMAEAGFTPASALYSFTHQGTRYHAQNGVKITSGDRRVYYHRDGQSDTIRHEQL